VSAPDKIREDRIKYLSDEKHIKAITVMFSDLEGRIHLLDYDKKFLINSYDNLTFDGSSIRGFTVQKESDLRLGIDWSAFYWVPRGCVRDGQGAGLRHRDRQGRRALLGRHARRTKTLLRQAVRGEGLDSKRGQRN